jgi:hypothetical protein
MHCACPATSDVGPHLVVVDSFSVMVPVGGPPLPDTVAVKVTACATAEGFAFEASAVVLASFGWKLAVTAAAAFICTVHAPVPEHAPDQPVKREPAAGVGVSVTEVVAPKFAVQVAPQEMPGGDEVTVPVPEPARVTVSA